MCRGWACAGRAGAATRGPTALNQNNGCDVCRPIAIFEEGADGGDSEDEEEEGALFGLSGANQQGRVAAPASRRRAGGLAADEGKGVLVRDILEAEKELKVCRGA